MLLYFLSLIETASDKAFFTSLYLRYERKTYAFALRFFPKIKDAEDLTHDAWVQVIINLPIAKKCKSESKRAFEAWLFTVEENIAKDRLRKKKREPETVELWDMPAPEDEVHSDYRMVVDAIHSMPGPMRAVLLMRLIEERSFREIAKVLKCDEVTAKRRFERARRALIERLGVKG